MGQYDFARLDHFGENWLARQYVMRARFAETYVLAARRVLDIASGSGYCTYHLARTNPRAEVVGADISPGALEYASAAYRLPNLRFEYGDAFELPQPTGHFDLVVSYETLEHVLDGRGFIRGLARVTHRDGVFLCSTPNLEYDVPIAQHVKVYAPRELFDLLREFFEEVEEFYQFQSRADRAGELRGRRWESLRLLPLRVAVKLMPGRLKRGIKKALGRDDAAGPRPYVIQERQVYPPEAVTPEDHRPGADPRILVAVCRKPRHERTLNPAVQTGPT